MIKRQLVAGKLPRDIYRGLSWWWLDPGYAQLHLTQPAVNNDLARLRQQFDGPLFIRDGRRMAPSLRARKIAPESNRRCRR